MKLSLYFETKPHYITQVWGIFNQFYRNNGLNFDYHNGEDVAPGKDKTWRYPIAGYGRVIRTDTVGNTAGGIFCGVLSNDKYEDSNGRSGYVLIDGLHAEKLLVSELDTISPCQPLFIQDNTGLSTGPHTHGQYRWVDWIPYTGGIIQAYRIKDGMALVDLDKNGANNSFDPRPYRNGFHAADYNELLGYVPIIKKMQNAVAAMLEQVKGRNKNQNSDVKK